MTEIDLTPITRLEYDIDAILNDHAVAEPITRIELILADIVAGNTTTVVPVTRIETFLAIISGADYPVPEPVTRIETFLAIIAGENYETPEAVTRLEGLLAEWVEKGAGIWKTVSGSLIHITDALASPMQKCEVTLEPIQAGSGDPSPDNVRPITGWTGCEVTRTGKNLVENVLQGCAINGVGQIFFSSGFNVVVAKVKKGVTYTLNDNVSPSNNSVYAFYTETPIVGSLPYNGNRVVTTNYTFTSPIDGYVGFRVPDDFQYPQVEIGTERTDYEPYSGTTLSVTFPSEAGTVYGGVLKVVTGELVVDRAEVDLGTLSWAYTSGGQGYFLTNSLISMIKKVPDNNTVPNMKCSNYKEKAASSLYVGSIGISSTTTGAVWVYDNSYGTDSSAFASAMSGVQLVYELATPITYQLTPQQIATLKGENNVWSNGDSVEITYKAQAE